MHSATVDDVLERLLAGVRPSVADAAELAAHADLITLGLAARARSAADAPVTFTVDRTIILDNICDPGCPWCSDTVAAGAPSAWSLSRDRVLAAAARAVAQGARQLVLQGGHRTDLPLEHYTGLLNALRTAHPQVELAGFSATEVLTWSQSTGLRLDQVLQRLRASGLAALLAAGGEALTSRIQEHRRLLDGPWPEWEEVIAAAARAGLPVIVPVPFGLGEDPADRAAYLLRLRDLQERTGAIAALLPFAPAVAPPMPGESDELRVVESGRSGAAPNPAQLMATGHEYLRMVALCRLVVENVPHISASPLTQGAKVAQVALDCGADDFGGTHLQFELAELAAGRVGPMTAPEFARLIRDAGRQPAWRNAGFRLVDLYND